MALNGLTNPSLIIAHATTHESGSSTDPILYERGDNTSGVLETISREWGLAAQPTGNTGTLNITYFTANMSLTMNNLLVVLSNVFSGQTYQEFALYTAASDGALTMVRRTGDLSATSLTVQTTQGSSTTTNTGMTATGIYLIPMNKDQNSSAASNYSMVRGTRYALGIVSAASTTVGKFLGVTGGVASSVLYFSSVTFNTTQAFMPFMAKQVAGSYSSGSPIPTSHTGSAGAGNTFRHYGAFIA